MMMSGWILMIMMIVWNRMIGMSFLRSRLYFHENRLDFYYLTISFSIGCFLRFICIFYLACSVLQRFSLHFDSAYFVVIRYF